MNSSVFSESVLSQIRNSAYKYAQEIFEVKQKQVSLTHRIQVLTGYKSNEKRLNTYKELEIIISLVNSNLLECRKKANEKSANYISSRHMDLNILSRDLKERRDKLSAHHA